MSNISDLLSGLLKKHDARLRGSKPDPTKYVDEFIKEAYNINSHIHSLHTYLRSIRQGYLSTSLPPHRQRAHTSQNRQYFTDAQRDQIDAEAKATLRDTNAGIKQLEQVEKIRRDTQDQIATKKRTPNGFTALSKWAAGGSIEQVKLSPEEELEEAQQKTINIHRESVIWFLRQRLDDAAGLQRELMETRLEREIEKNKSILYKTKGGRDLIADRGITIPSSQVQLNGGVKPGHAGVPEDKTRDEIEQTLSPEQLQLFAQENNEMMKHYEDTLDQVRHAEKSMVEISELQTTLAQNLEIQSTQIGQLVQDSENTEQNVSGGNIELKQATKRWRPARAMFWASCGLSAFLIAWDLII